MKRLEEEDICVLRETDGKIVPNPLSGRFIKSYFSLNEINYIAFDEPSIEYHQELLNKIECDWVGVSTGSYMKPLTKWICDKYPDIKNKIDRYIGDHNREYGEHISLNDNEYKAQGGNHDNEHECICACVRNAVDHTCEENKKWKDDKYVILSLKIMTEIAPKVENIVEILKHLNQGQVSKLDEGGTKNYNISGVTEPHQKNYCIWYKMTQSKPNECKILKDDGSELEPTLEDVFKALKSILFK